MMILKTCPVCGSPIHRGKCVRWPVCNFKESIINELPDEFISFDLETTGLLNDESRIIEIGAVRMKKVQDGIYKEVDCFSQLVNPGKDVQGNQIYISQFITNLTGISNEMVKNEPVESECVKAFLDWCGEDVVMAGQNIAKFDIPFVKRAAKRAGTKWKPQSYIDSLIIADNLRLKQRGLVKDHKQPTLARWLGFTYNAHRAVDDCRACARIIQLIAPKAKEEQVPIVVDC